MSPPSHHDHHHHHHAHKPHPLADESEEEGYSSHPSIYSASPVDSLLDGASSPKPSPSTVFSPSTDHIEYKSAPSTPYATDSDSDYGTAFHYEYASPAQPIHPARSSDMRGAPSPFIPLPS